MRRLQKEFGSLFKTFVFLALLILTAMSAEATDPQFNHLTAEELAHMDKQRAYVTQFISEHFPGLHVTRTKADFAILQKIVDSKLIKKEETWKLQSLGIVFGDGLISTIDGLAWWEISDEYGNDPTLRYRATTLQVNTLTMISKRIEDGKDVDIEDLAKWVADTLKSSADKYK